MIGNCPGWKCVDDILFSTDRQSYFGQQPIYIKQIDEKFLHQKKTTKKNMPLTERHQILFM